MNVAGTVADTHVPIKAQFPLAKVPIGVCLDIDINMIPLSIELSVEIRIIFITYSKSLAKFSSASLSFPILKTCPAGPGPATKATQGFLIDATSPIVTLSGASQVPNESLSAPFVFARFGSYDLESGIESVSIGVGWSPADNQIIAPQVMARGQGDSWTIPMPADVKLDEKTLFVNVFHKNQQNLTTTTSTPFLFDLSAPVIVSSNKQTPWDSFHFTPGRHNPRAILRRNMAPFSSNLEASVNGLSYTSEGRVCFSYAIVDATAQRLAQYAIGTGQSGAEASNVLPWTVDRAAGLTPKEICGNHIGDGLYYLNVNTTSELGFVTTHSSPPTIVDLTPPISGNIYFGQIPGVNSNGTIIDSVAYFSIDGGFLDPESDVAYWQFNIGPSDLAPATIESDVSLWQPFRGWTPYLVNDAYSSYLLQALHDVEMGEGNHTICVNTVNFVGLAKVKCAQGYVVDQTPPSGSITLEATQDLRLIAQFNYSDDRSTVKTVMIGLGDHYAPHFADFVTLDVGAKPQSNFTFATDVRMQGQLVHGLLIVIDYATNSFKTFSDQPVLVDMLPPDAGLVFDGKERGSDLAWIGDITQLCASWTPWSSKVTMVDSYDLCFGSYQGACDIFDWQAVGNQQVVCIDLPANMVKQIPPVVFDPTPPEQFIVNITTPTSKPFVRDIQTLRVIWTTANEPDSGLTGYEVALFRRRGNDTVALTSWETPDQSLPQQQSALVRGPSSASDGDRVFACVRVPLTPIYVNDTARIDLLWEWSSNGIRAYTHEPLSTQVTQVLADEKGCHIRALGQLVDGATYQAVGKVESFSGVPAETAFFFTVTTTPPTFIRGGSGSTALGKPDVLTTTEASALRAWCEFASAIPIASYAFAFGSVANERNLTNGWIYSMTSAISLPFNVSVNTYYYAACTATNAAGQVSLPQYFSVGTKIVSGAKAGVVYDGPFPEVETSEQTSVDTIVATFEPITM
ncbi:hypothetical protein HDU86_007628 [Geranomyces michiganensis]|nr:hypothetical protein HDU86_007628 [Geranomyces michiganensis]